MAREQWSWDFKLHPRDSKVHEFSLYCGVGYDLKLFTLETHLENPLTYYRSLVTTFFLASSLVITPNTTSLPPARPPPIPQHSTEGFSPLLEHPVSFISVYFLHSAHWAPDTIPHALADYKTPPDPMTQRKHQFRWVPNSPQVAASFLHHWLKPIFWHWAGTRMRPWATKHNSWGDIHFWGWGAESSVRAYFIFLPCMCHLLDQILWGWENTGTGKQRGLSSQARKRAGLGRSCGPRDPSRAPAR